LHKEIALKFSKDVGLSTLGINAMKVLLKLLTQKSALGSTWCLTPSFLHKLTQGLLLATLCAMVLVEESGGDHSHYGIFP